jgi:hypothetical protein
MGIEKYISGIKQTDEFSRRLSQAVFGKRNIMIKIPYGICDFYKIITEGYFYADRTDRIRLIEAAGDQLLFLRPRRFGKTLLLSMLRNYYDLAMGQEFNRVFGHLAAGKNPTPLHNQYFVLMWDFSAVSPAGDSEQIRKALHAHINGCIEQFIARYRDILDYPIVLDETDALRSFQSVLAAVSTTPYKLYLMIDEYDNFANEVIMSGQAFSQERYQEVLYSALKPVLKAIKSASAGQGLDRVLMTGVSPIAISDAAGAYNIAENIYLRAEFNDLCGFRESEIGYPLKQIAGECQIPSEKAAEGFSLMQTFYKGYCFSPSSVHDNVYNPALALYFMKMFQLEGQYPKDIADSNLVPDPGKIAYFLRLPGGEQAVLDSLNEEHPLSIGRLSQRFGLDDVMYPPDGDHTFFVSLLYYHGILTYSGRTPMGRFILKIPNLAVKELYLARIQKILFSDQRKNKDILPTENFHNQGDAEPVYNLLETI